MRSDHLEGCPFCEYASVLESASGARHVEVNDRRIFSDPTRPVISFEPLNPVVGGHLLFVPTWHAEHRDPTGLTAATRSAYDYATSAGGDFNLINSCGPAATQTVPHLHVHYVPRRPGDGLLLPWGGPR